MPPWPCTIALGRPVVPYEYRTKKGWSKVICSNISGAGSDSIFFFQAGDGIRDWSVTGVQTCALPIFAAEGEALAGHGRPGDLGGQRAHEHGEERERRPRARPARRPRRAALGERPGAAQAAGPYDGGGEHRERDGGEHLVRG